MFMLIKRKFLILSIFLFTLTYLSASITSAQTVTIGAGSTLNIGNSTVNAQNIVINGTLEATTGTVNVSGDWANNGTFTSGTGAVTFDSLSQPQSVTTGGASSSFKILNVENVSASGVTFADPLHCATLNAGAGVKQLLFNTSTHTITFDFNVSGSSANLITLASLTSGFNWTLDAPDGIFVQYLNVSDSAAISGINTSNCVDGGNNTNWLFDADGDGVPDADDNCPELYNPYIDPLDPLSGQNDTDGDGRGNVCDNCPSDYNPLQLDDDDNGIGNLCETDEPVPEEERPTSKNGPPEDPLLADDDGDGLTNGQEAELGTDALNPDTDSDGPLDGEDNCPSIANSGQEDNDLDGIGDVCDGDDDDDGHLDVADNCQFDFNPDQADLDLDGEGDVCDPDVDGDGYTAGIDDCDDFDSLVHLFATEIPGNGKDDDCDPLTLDSDNFIVFTTDVVYGEWLPKGGSDAGRIVNVTATVHGPTGALSTQPAIEFNLVSVTNYAGQYTNHESIDTSDDYAYPAFPSPGSSITLTSNDYGGSITINAKATIDLEGGGVLLLSKDFTLPKDSDNDGLPDAWEVLYVGDLTADGDIDASVMNSFIGDGLTNFEEYRGFMWKNLSFIDPPDLTNDPYALYKTPAYVPMSNVSYFRTHPTQLISDPTDTTGTGTKDLFVKYTNYSPSNPFAIGEAFDNAGIDVHAVDSATATGLGEANIDVLLVTNDLDNTYLGADGHINRRGVRDWSWDTKGSSNLGTALAYGAFCTTYQKPLTNYFNDKPYIDSTTLGTFGVLDPINLVDDKNDNASNDRVKGEYESGCQACALDGDLVEIGAYLNQLTAFNIDGGELDHFMRVEVELPVTSDPNNIDSNFEYTAEQVLKHTITHEMGHAVGMSHNQVSNSLMFEFTNNWSRDNFFSDDSKAQIQLKHVQ